MTIHVPSVEQLPDAARQFAQLLHLDTPGPSSLIPHPSSVIAFHAPMGAGKTTFISAIARELGVSEPVTSPTFAIVNEYTVPPLPPGGRQGGSTLYHFDFYRIKSLQEALDIGVEDYFYSGNLCLIEWPELIEPLLPNGTIHVTIAVNPDGSRDIIPSKELKEKL